jgi:leucyl aminopeptidase
VAVSERLQVAPGRLEAPGSWAGAAGDEVRAVGVPVYAGGESPELPTGLPPSLEVGGATLPLDLDAAWCRERGFAAKAGQTLLSSAPHAPALVFVGVGPRDGLDPEGLRRLAAALVRAGGRAGAAVLLLPDDVVAAAAHGSDATTGARRAAQAVAEGAVLASYRFVSHKSSTDDGERDGERVGALVVAAAGDPAAVEEGTRRGTRIAEAVWLARDLVNEPPSTLTPRRLAEIAEAELTPERGIELEVWNEERILSERLGGLLGVARGSNEPPRLLRATYVPDQPRPANGRVPHVVLVGKGITFDSGGLSLKTAGGMTTMKTDMSGAAAVLATLSACRDLGVGVRVTVIAPATENMPGGRAIKPGDVLTIRNGKTIEVLNTDAEGRLILADGLSLAAELEPDAVIDLATLTGAAIVALGSQIAGLFANDDDLAARVRRASEDAGEPSWPLPLPEDYRHHIDSDVADMKNMGKDGQAGSIAAAMLLARFVGDVPWAHLDIAGPARSDEDRGTLTKGGTGFGVRTLLALLETWSG